MSHYRKERGMLFPDNFLKRDVEEDEKVEATVEEVVEVSSLEELVDELIRRGISDIEDADIYSDKFTAGTKNLKDLGELYEKVSKAKSEAEKAKAQVLEAESKKKPIIGDQTIARLVGIAASFGIIIFWTGLEQSRPIPMRVARFAEAMTVPKL